MRFANQPSGHLERGHFQFQPRGRGSRLAAWLYRERIYVAHMRRGKHRRGGGCRTRSETSPEVVVLYVLEIVVATTGTDGHGDTAFYDGGDSTHI